MNYLELVDNVLTLDREAALLAKFLGSSLHFSIALLTERPSLVLNKPHIGQVGVADDTLEAVWVPALAHGTNYSANDELTTPTAAWRKECLEVVLTILAALMLKEDTIRKRLKALDTDEASLVPDLSSRVNDVLVPPKRLLA